MRVDRLASSDIKEQDRVLCPPLARQIHAIRMVAIKQPYSPLRHNVPALVEPVVSSRSLSIGHVPYTSMKSSNRYDHPGQVAKGEFSLYYFLEEFEQ